MVNRLSQCLLREQQLTSLLTTAPENHLASIERFQKERRLLNSKVKRLEDESSTLVVDKLLLEAGSPEQKFYSLVRSDDELSQLHKLASAFKTRKPEGTIFLVSQLGSFLLTGPEAIVTPELFRQLLALLNTKGGGKGGSYQGSLPPPALKTTLERLPEILSFLQSAVENFPSSSSGAASSV